MGWWELSIVGLITILVLGPKELPYAMKSLARFMRKARRLASEFQGHMDDIVKEAELGDMKQTVKSFQEKDIGSLLDNTLAPINDVKSEIQSSISEVKKDLDDVKENNSQTSKNKIPSMGSNNEDSVSSSEDKSS
jgi:sec-independent protein translocase protein TatB